MLSRYLKEHKTKRNTPDSQTNDFSHVRAPFLLQNVVIALQRQFVGSFS